MPWTCLYIGRFQPFHIWHLDAIAQIFEQGYKKIHMVVGSVNESWTERNPFTYPERETIIRTGLYDRWIDQDRIELFPVPDFSEDDDWYAYIVDMIDFDAVMSGNDRVVDIFKQHTQKVLEELERIPIHGVDIRARIRAWQRQEAQKRVTPGVYKLLLNHPGI